MLVKVDPDNQFHMQVLYWILEERYSNADVINIDGSDALSELPTFDEHCEFIKKNPYKHFYFYQTASGTVFVGTIYLKENLDIGIFVRQHMQQQGLATIMLQEFLETIPEKQITATVSVKNDKSNNFFKKMGFKHSGNFYVLEQE